jgi:hypothetical protein
MKKERDIDPAFPTQFADNEGMSLRDYFAAKAMQGLIASNDEEAGDRITEIPEYAYRIADAMLAEREKK